MGVRSILSTSRTADKSPSLSWPSLTRGRPWRNRLYAALRSLGMLWRYRRYFAILAFGLLATPLVVGMVKPDSPELIFKEGRRLAPAPAAPNRLADLGLLPGQIDAYLKDHFGFRHVLI